MSKTKPPETLPAVPDAPAPTEPAAIQRPNLGMFAHYSALPATEDGGIITTMDLSSPAAFAAMQNILAGGGESLWDLSPDRIISVTHATAHFARRVDEETGEETAGPMLTLSGPDGVYHTGSQYAFRALQLIAIRYGGGPWNPPLRIRAVRVRSRNKRDFQSILLCNEE